MRQIAGRSLWVGHAGDLRNVAAVTSLGIEAVVELADNEPLAALPRDLIRLRFPLSDGGDNPAWLLRLAAESVAALLRSGVPTLVCCSAGMNRSVCVAAAGLALENGLSFPVTLLGVIGDGPADVSPRLVLQFRDVLPTNQ